MKSIFATVIALGLAISSVFAQTPGLTINTPSLPTVCQTILLSWTNNGKGPFTVSILTADQSSSLFAFPPTNATQVSWLVDIAAGTSIILRVVDNLGESSLSASVMIQANTANTNATSCIGSTSYTFDGTSPPSGGGATATATSPSGGTTASPLTGSTGNTGTTNSGSAATPGSSAGTSATRSSSTTSQSAGAYRVTGQIATAGIIGAAMVALLG